MSQFHLVDFNGSIKRNKIQDAVFNTLDEKQRFLKNLEEQRMIRLRESRLKSAAVLIQRDWRRYAKKLESHKKLREDFDKTGKCSNVESLLIQIRRIGMFYRHKHPNDDSRLMSTCLNALELCEKSPMDIPPYLKIFFSRRILQYLQHISASTNITSVLRFIEVFLTSNEFMSICDKDRYFYVLMEVLSVFYQPTSPIEINDQLQPRLRNIFSFLVFPLLQSSETQWNKLITYLIRDLLVHPNVQCIATIVLPHVLQKIQEKNISLSAIQTIAGNVKSSDCNDKKVFVLYCAVSFLFCLNTEEEKISLFSLLASILQSVELQPSPNETIAFLQNSINDGFKSQMMETLVIFAINCPRTHIEDIFVFSDCPSLQYIFKNYHERPIEESHSFLMRIFGYIVEARAEAPKTTSTSFQGNDKTYLSSLKCGWSIPSDDCKKFQYAISFCSSFLSSIFKSSVDDDFRPDGALHSLIPNFIVITKEFLELSLGLIDLAFPDDFWCTSQQAEQKRKEATHWINLHEELIATLQVIYRKNNRVMFLPPNFWTSHNRQVVISRKTWIKKGRFRHLTHTFAFVRFLHDPRSADSDSDNENSEVSDEVPPSSTDLRNLSIIRSIPFVVPFEQRLAIFRNLLHHDRKDIGADDFMDIDPWGRHVNIVRIRRQYLYDDAFAALTPGQHPNLRLPLKVSMVNWVGVNEAGQDGGGIFREFISELLKTGFDPNRGLFTYTHDRFLYPNPNAVMIYNENYSQHFYFLGRIVAKLIYEGLMMDMHFADFFLVQLLATSNKNLVDLEQMKSYDPTIYKHLYNLLNSTDEQIRALSLDFSIMVDNLGKNEIIDLIPNGRNIEVNHSNRREYVDLYVNYFLNKQIEPFIDAMRSGLSNVMNPAWLAMFDPSELQIIVSGADKEIDVDDMRQYSIVHTDQVSGIDEYMHIFWDVVKSFTNEEKGALLKFITGCPRPPIEGFKFLQPNIGIQVVSADGNQLPMSATCMNLFKLPKYENRQVLEEKLRYAINSGAGFEMQ